MFGLSFGAPSFCMETNYLKSKFELLSGPHIYPEESIGDRLQL